VGARGGSQGQASAQGFGAAAMGSAFGTLACCCCACGVLAAYRRYQQPAVQRYMAVHDDESDDEDEPFDEVGEEEPGNSPAQETTVTPVVRPRSPPQDLLTGPTPGEATESWVAEMNAELAEFDNLTFLPTGTGAPSPQAAWQPAMEAELASHIRK